MSVPALNGISLPDVLIQPAPSRRPFWRRAAHWLVQGFGVVLAYVVAPIVTLLALVALGWAS